MADHREAAEQHLLAQAEHHDAKALAVPGKHLLEVVAPDQADALIAKQLERDEAEARKTAYVKTWSDGHGSFYGKFKIPDHPAMVFKTALEAYANPHRPTRSPGRASPPPRCWARSSSSSSSTCRWTNCR